MINKGNLTCTNFFCVHCCTCNMMLYQEMEGLFFLSFSTDLELFLVSYFITGNLSCLENMILSRFCPSHCFILGLTADGVILGSSLWPQLTGDPRMGSLDSVEAHSVVPEVHQLSKTHRDWNSKHRACIGPFGKCYSCELGGFVRLTARVLGISLPFLLSIEILFLLLDSLARPQHEGFCFVL